MKRLAVIGDVGGHEKQLRQAVEALGCDSTEGSIPAGLTVCQVGDLVHRGPDSDAVIRLVDKFRQRSSEQWVQLVGNHESQYLRTPSFTWPQRVSDESARTMRQWWSDGWMRMAEAFTTEGVELRRSGGVRERVGRGEILLTHAGLTAGLWGKLGRPSSAREAADAILVDSWERACDDFTGVWGLGAMLSGTPDSSAGVLWAESSSELLGSWLELGKAGPFHQAHGHTSGFNWRDGRWREPLATWLRRGGTAEVALSSHVWTQQRVTLLELANGGPGQAIFGCDPCHGRWAAKTWEPLLLPDRAGTAP